MNKTRFIVIFGMILILTTFSAANASWGLAVRGGYLMSPNWADTYDVAYDNGGEMVLGVELDYSISQHWEIGLAVDMISGDGERVWLDGTGNWVKTGEGITFDMMPISLITRWYFMPQSMLSPYAGAGIGYTNFEETDDDSESGIGYIALGGLRLSASDAFHLLFEAEFSSYPDIIGDGDLSYHFNEDDVGGITLRLGLKYTF